MDDIPESTRQERVFPPAASLLRSLVTPIIAFATLTVPLAAEEAQSAVLPEGRPMTALTIMVLMLLLRWVLIAAQTAASALGESALERLSEQQSSISSRFFLSLAERRTRLAAGSAGASRFLLLAALFYAAEVMGLLLGEGWLRSWSTGILLVLFLDATVGAVLIRRHALTDALRVFRLAAIPAWLLGLPFRWMKPKDPPETGTTEFLTDEALSSLTMLQQIDRVMQEETYELLDSVREFTETIASEVMTPRTEIEAIPASTPAPELFAYLRSTTFTRVIVYEKSLDSISGILIAKEILLQKPANPMTLLRQPLYVAKQTRLPELLDEIRRTRTHLAVVQDEYGGTAGIVTLHDLFEAIVGQLSEEGDIGEPWMEERDGVIHLDGRVELWELTDRFGLEFEDGDARTIAGLVMKEAGLIPPPGTEVEFPHFTARVEEVHKTRIHRLSLRPKDPEMDSISGLEAGG